jgi:hypothetical protein
MVFIYVLQLEQEKYYIGKTENPNFRIEQHFQSGGAVWTKKYNPISVIKIIPDCDDYDEDKYTRKYMDNYGIDNVRGGSFCEIILDQTTIKLLEKMSKTTQNKCFTCGIIGHFSKECKNVSQMDPPSEEPVMEKVLKKPKMRKFKLDGVSYVADENNIVYRKDSPTVRVGVLTDEGFELDEKEEDDKELLLSSISSIDDCFTFIETFIEDKKQLELVDPKFERPKCTFAENGKLVSWSSNQDELLRKETERANKQKEKNDEYLPLFKVFYKALQYINEK